MSWLGLRSAFELAVRRLRDPDRELKAELDAHVALRVEHLIEQGRSPEQARREALERFGDFEGTRHTLAVSTRQREGRIRRLEWFGSLRQDVTLALRQVARAPGFSLVSILTLGLGVGLTTAVFAAIDGVLLRPLPFAEPERLVGLQSVDSAGNPIVVVSADNWDDWRRDNRTFSAMAIYATIRVGTAAEGSANRTTAAMVPAEFFPTLQPKMAWGRPFSSAEVREGAPVLVVGEGYWRRSLGGRTDADLRVLVNGRPATVVGVVASGQEFPGDAELWIPYRHQQQGGGARNNINWFSVGRLNADVTVEQARSDLGRVARSIRTTEPVALYSYGVNVVPLRDLLVGDSASTLELLMGAVILVLLIGCANLASAGLARGAARRGEMAVRMALGAGRSRVLRQIVVEQMVFALLGGLLGCGLAWALTRFLSVAAESEIPRIENIGVDPRVLGFGLVVAVLSGLLTALFPGWQASRTSPQAAMVDGGRSSKRWGRGLPGHMLVGFEIAMALMLVAGAGLLIQSLRTALDQPLGFETKGVVTAPVLLATPDYNRRAPIFGYWDRIAATLGTIPGVESVGFTNSAPLGMAATAFIEIAGKDLPGAGAGFQTIGGAYFEALGIPLLAGRTFAANDDTSGARVAIISRLLADRYFAGEDPLGAQIRTPGMEPTISTSGGPWATIVGVVGDVRRWGHETEPRPEIYLSYRQATYWAQSLTAIVRGRPGGATLANEVRARAAAIDRSIPVEVDQLDAQADRLMAPRRFSVLVLGTFGFLALGLAAIGVYGVLSFAVAQRKQELGIRSALGASRHQLLRQVLVSGGWVIAIGLLAGHLGAALLAAVIRAQLFGVGPRDPTVLVVATVTIAGIGALAAWLPARRAAATDPMVILRRG